MRDSRTWWEMSRFWEANSNSRRTVEQVVWYPCQQRISNTITFCSDTSTECSTLWNTHDLSMYTASTCLFFRKAARTYSWKRWRWRLETVVLQRSMPCWEGWIILEDVKLKHFYNNISHNVSPRKEDRLLGANFVWWKGLQTYFVVRLDYDCYV